MSLGNDHHRQNNRRRFTSLVNGSRREAAIFIIGVIACWLCLEMALLFVADDIIFGIGSSWAIPVDAIVGFALASLSVFVTFALGLKHRWLFAAYVLIAVAWKLTSESIIASFGYSRWIDNADTFLSFALSPISLIAVVLVFAGNWREPLAQSIRLEMPNRPILSFAMPLLIWIVFILALSFIATTYGFENQTQHRSQMYFDQLGNNVVLALAIMAVLVPIGEELMFRGLLMTLLQKLSHTIVAIVVSALGFALLHIDPLFSTGLSHVYIFGMGILLATSTVVTRSIWPSIFIHSVNNSLVVYAVAST